MNYIPGDFTVVAADSLLVRVDNETVVYGTTPTKNIQSVQYFNGGTGLVTLNRVGATNTFDDGANGTVTFSVVAANPNLSVGGNLSVGTYGLGVDTLFITGTNFSGTPVVAGSLNVTPLSVQVSGITAANKVYDRNNSATVTGGTIASLLGDAVSVSTAGVTASFVDKMVADNKSVTASGYALAGADASNYQLVQPAALSANITPLNLNVTGVTASSKAYDGTAVATINGGVITLADGEAVSLITSGVVGSFADAAVFNAKSVTATGFAISGADATNYELVQPSDLTADITRRQLTFSNVAAASKVYDRNTTTTGSLSLVGIVGSEIVSANVGTALFVDKNVGDQKTVNLSGITLTGTDAANYEVVTTATATADITPLALTLINQSATSRVYDATLIATGSVTLSGVIAGDTVGVTTPTARFLDKNVGTNKTVNLTDIALTGNDAGNYTVASSTTAQANITTRSLTITGVTAADKVYDRLTNATISGGAISVLNTDIVNLDVSGATATFVDKNVGTKSVTATGYVISGTDAANYSLVQPSGVTAAITAAPLTITGANTSVVYDATTQTNVAATVTGLIGAETVTISSYGSGRNVGNYADTLSVTAGTNTLLSNYAITQTNGALTITPYQLSFGTNGGTGPRIVGSANDKVYNADTTATGSISVLGLLGGDTLTATATTVTFDTKNVGTAKTVTFGGIIMSGDVTLTNYTLGGTTSLTTTAAITPLYVTLASLKASDKNYDGNTVAKATGTLVGVLAGDSAQVGSLTGTFSDAQIGTDKTVTITTGVLTGADSANYQITPGLTTTASITTNDSSINNFILGPSKIPGIGGFKTLDLLDIKYPLPTTFLVDSVGAVKPGEPTILQTGEIGARPVMGYYASEEESTGESNYCYIYPKVNLGRSYYVGVLSGNAAKAAGGKSVDTLKVK